MFDGQNTVLLRAKLKARVVPHRHFFSHEHSSLRTYFSVLAQVDAKMVRPEPQRPFEGLITIHCELSPMASMEYEPGRYAQITFPRVRFPI